MVTAQPTGAKTGQNGANGSGAIGAWMPHPENAEKVKGITRYAADYPVTGMLHGRTVGSLYANARITRIDASAAKAVPGVVAVYTAADLKPALKGPINSRAREVLADGVVRFAGQPVALVLAESEAAAEDALGLVEIEYESQDPVVDPLAAMKADSTIVWPEGLPGASAEAAIHGNDPVAGEGGERLSRNVSATINWSGGDIEAGFKEADAVVERRFHTQRLHQAYMEPHACVAAIDPLGTVTVWTSTQGQFFARGEVAELLGLPQGKVKIVPLAVGGGFGGKVVLLEPLAAAAAVLSGRPVSLVYTRTDEFLNATPTPQCIMEVKVGAKKDGTLTAIDARVIFDSGLYPGAPTPLALNSIGAVYSAPNFRLRGYEVLTNTVPNGAFRGPGATQGAFAMDAVLDDLARELNMDPIDLRLKNLCQEGDKLPNGRTWTRIGMRECLEALKAHPLWAERGQQKSADGRYVEGVGVASGVWMGGLQPAGASCRVESDGVITVVVGSNDISGVNASLVLMAAETLGVDPSMVRLAAAPSDNAPFAGVAGGSKTTLTVGAAVVKAAEDAKRQMFEIAADQMEASPSDLEIRDGQVQVKGVPTKTVSIKRLANLSMAFGGKYEPIDGRGASAVTISAPGAAAHLAKVRVDTETGEIHVTDYVAAQDCGRAIHPPSVIGQMEGGALQGIGWALYEEMVTDEYGQVVTGTFMDYALPHSEHAPTRIEAIVVEVPSASGPFGVRGVGEPAVLPGPGAVTNALRDALGVRFESIPVKPEHVVKALHGGA